MIFKNKNLLMYVPHAAIRAQNGKANVLPAAPGPASKKESRHEISKQRQPRLLDLQLMLTLKRAVSSVLAQVWPNWTVYSAEA